MGLYFFALQDEDRHYPDQTGVELANDEAALDYAQLIAAELMKNREQQTRHWRIDVRDEEGSGIGVVNFATAELMSAPEWSSVVTRMK